MDDAIIQSKDIVKSFLQCTINQIFAQIFIINVNYFLEVTNLYNHIFIAYTSSLHIENINSKHIMTFSMQTKLKYAENYNATYYKYIS